MFRRTLAVALLAFSLAACGSDTESIADSVADIREHAPAMAHASDEELTALMRKACGVLDETDGNLAAFALVAIQNDLDGHDVGVVAANAIQSMCPEYDPNK